MPNKNLWKYCTTAQCRELLTSFKLFGNTTWTDEEQIKSLYILSKNITKHYSTMTIPKRDGTLRHLLVPDVLLKKIQRNILHRILDQMPVSLYATAYRKGSNVIANAAAHVGKKLILKLDIEDFFGSISFPMVYKSTFPNLYFPPPIRVLLTNLCCYNDYLPQGAPTSATISNLVMRPFDEYIGQWCTTQGVTYTRYCDDMVFSGDFNHQIVKNKVQPYLQEMGFRLNKRKTRVIDQHHKQTVTGIMVNTKVQTTIQYRKALRKEIYYCQKYGVVSHLTQMGDNDYLPFGKEGITKYISSLLGKINFILLVNPHDRYFKEAKLTIENINPFI